MEDEAKKLVHLSFSFRGVKTQDASLDPQMMLRQLGDIVSVQTGVQLMALKLVVVRKQQMLKSPLWKGHGLAAASDAWPRKRGRHSPRRLAGLFTQATRSKGR